MESMQRLSIPERMRRVIEKSIIAPEVLYHCGVCLDEGYLHRDKMTSSGTYEGTVARFCEGCTRGLTIEAGHWAWRLAGRHPPPKAVDGFKDRQRHHPDGLRLRDLVQEVMSKGGKS